MECLNKLANIDYPIYKWDDERIYMKKAFKYATEMFEKAGFDKIYTYIKLSNGYNFVIRRKDKKHRDGRIFLGKIRMEETS